MRISTDDWVNYINKLSEIDKAAAETMQRYVQTHGFGNTEELIETAYAVASKYGEAAAELTCQMYDACAEAQGVTLPAAEPAETATMSEVAKTVNGTINNPEIMQNAVGRLVKRTGADTMLKNAERDGAEFAWVPHGDTCAFCITLASRGWQHISKKTLKNGHAEHIHANCDCTYAVRFDGKSNVEGYDPDKYKRMYYDADPNGSPQDKINAMRRNIYDSPEKKMIRLAKGGNIFVSRYDNLFEFSKKITPIEGYEDIVVHGDEYGLAFIDVDGKESNISTEEFCNILENSEAYKGGNIRLISCKTGYENGIVPTYIAKRFNIEVIAPTEVVNVDFDGNMILANDEWNAKMGIETGEWVKFNSKGRVE